jgi:ABC-type transport system involved in cytochrome bd biosynthesis fused ATPase/permease subunit
MPASALGVFSSLAFLSLAALGALAISDVAEHQVNRGILLLMLTTALRWLVASVLDEWSRARAARERSWWRSRIVFQLRRPRREGDRARGDLALAVDHAAAAPELERLRAGAATSLVGVLIVWRSAGWIALVITLGLLALSIPLYARSGRRSDAAAQRYRARRATLEVRQLEVLQHAPELRALGAVTYGADEIAALSDSEHALAMRAIRVALESSLVTEFLSGVSVGLVAMVVGFALLEGHLSLVRALLAVLVTAELFTQIRRYGVEFHRRENAEKARDVLEVHDHDDPFTTDETLVAEALVTEAHDDEVSLSIGPGDRLVVTGPSGVGKTTLLHTLLGWREPRAGTSRRGLQPVGFVSAESTLLSGSLRTNLVLGADTSDAEVRAVLSSLGLRGERFSDLNAELTSDGRGLSDGEKVRILIARALLAHAALLVLDDVTGVLDEESRSSIRTALDAARGVAILEASVDATLLTRVDQRIELRA